MLTKEQEEKLKVAEVIAVASLYEFIAICSNYRLPTISATIRRFYKTQMGKATLWMGWGWLTAHFFVHDQGGPTDVSHHTSNQG